MRSHAQLVSKEDQSKQPMFSFFQWTANGDNGADGHLAQRHVEGELRFQQGGLKNKRRMEEESVWETHSEIGIATQIIATEVRLK